MYDLMSIEIYLLMGLSIMNDHVQILGKCVIVSPLSLGMARRSRLAERSGQKNRRLLCCGGSPEHPKGNMSAMFLRPSTFMLHS